MSRAFQTTTIQSTLALRTPRYYGHHAINDNKSLAETTMKCIEITLAITELRTLHVVPNKHFYCSTLVTTDTLDVFCTRHMKVNDFLIYRVTYLHLAICQRTGSAEELCL